MTRWARPPRRGFSLVELMVAIMLSSILLMYVAGIWQSYARSAAFTVASARVSAEARIALAALKHDFGGSLEESPTGTPSAALLVGRLVTGGQLLLCYDMPPLNGQADWAAPDRVVTYSLDGDSLVRSVDGGAAFVISRHVQQFTPQRLASRTEIDLTLEHRNEQRQFTFIAQDQ
jgi:prepilin-type N-terminal cleavage/methylation domain-containing protein